MKKISIQAKNQELWAVLEDNVVKNVIVADEAFITGQKTKEPWFGYKQSFMDIENNPSINPANIGGIWDEELQGFFDGQHAKYEWLVISGKINLEELRVHVSNGTIKQEHFLAIEERYLALQEELESNKLSNKVQEKQTSLTK